MAQIISIQNLINLEEYSTSYRMEIYIYCVLTP